LSDVLSDVSFDVLSDVSSEFYAPMPTPNLRELLEEKGYSIVWIACALQISNYQATMIIKTGKVTYEQAYTLSRIFSVPIERMWVILSETNRRPGEKDERRSHQVTGNRGGNREQWKKKKTEEVEKEAPKGVKPEETLDGDVIHREHRGAVREGIHPGDPDNPTGETEAEIDGGQA